MRKTHYSWLPGSLMIAAGLLAIAGCVNTPVDTSDYAQGPVPKRIQSPAKDAEACKSYEDSLTGGEVFAMYCSYCHNAPALSERNFANFRNVASHMRVRANLTGKEYAALMTFLRRWHDVPPPHPSLEPSPKRFQFSQPIPEQAEEAPRPRPVPPAFPPVPE